jgi:hypothetical protein
MMTNVEQLVEWELTGETEVLAEKLPQCHIVHQKSHMNPGRCGGKPATNHLSYGTASHRKVALYFLYSFMMLRSTGEYYRKKSKAKT